MQLQRNGPRRGAGGTNASTTYSPPSSKAASIAAALSLPYLNFTSPHNLKPVKLTLTPHHLFYLLSRFEELGVAVGPMNVRLENIHTDASPAEYVSFLSQAQRKKAMHHSDRDSVHSVSSLRSVMSNMTTFWSSFGLSSKSATKTEKQMAALKEDMRYLYSAFTKIPCLKLAPDHRARLIAGYEEFPFDTAVPLFAFKNLSALEISDVDFRQFYGWDRMADQLRSLTVRHACLDDPTDLLFNIVLDDMDRRRRKAAKAPGSPTTGPPNASPKGKYAELARYSSDIESPRAIRRISTEARAQNEDLLDASPGTRARYLPRPRSTSPARPVSSRHSMHHSRASMSQLRRSSGSSASSVISSTPRGSTSNLLTLGFLPPSKWRFLRHLSIADNSLTTLSVSSLAPVAGTLQSLDISLNLFTEVPESIASLTSLRALNLSDCMIESLHSLVRNPLPAVTTLNLKKNRLTSLAGVERLLSLERVDFRDNRLTDPMEMARLTGLPDIREVYVNRNPFTKTHTNYRITIFNVFRAAPGYTEDIVIDSQPPSYGERKQLVDRAPEPIGVPVVKPPLDEEVATLPQHESTVAIVVADDELQRLPEATAAPPAQIIDGLASQKRRKPARRRVVELVHDDTRVQDAHHGLAISDATPPLAPTAETTFTVLDPMPVTGDSPERPLPHTAQTQPASTAITLSSFPLEATSTEQQASPPASKASPPSAPSQPARSISDMPSSGAGADTYRQRIEALRNDLGPAWLSALTDESWDSPSLPRPAGIAAPVMPVRTQSQSLVTTGRTLG